MKHLILIIFALIVNQSWSQLSVSQKWERAQFEVNVNEKKVFATTIELNQSLSKSEWLRLNARFDEKEGIIELQVTENNSLKIYHMELVAEQSIKDLLLLSTSDFSIIDRIQIEM